VAAPRAGSVSLSAPERLRIPIPVSVVFKAPGHIEALPQSVEHPTDDWIEIYTGERADPFFRHQQLASIRRWSRAV
jgi:hypothetical protein